jgi:hypothetical protein
MTTFADGLYQYGGMPVGFDAATSKIFARKDNGRAWFVDPNATGRNTGKTPNNAFTTMQQAFNKAASGDIIYFVGKVLEQLVTPAQIFDVTVVGAGNRPRHADSTPDGGQYATAQWGPPASGAVVGQATVRVIQQGWRFINVLFTMESATAAGVEVVRNAGSGDDERDGSHAEILGSRFAGAGIGIRSGVAGSFTENTFNVLVKGNVFQQNTTAILQTAGFGGNGWKILDNIFSLNTNDITGPFSHTRIMGNSMSAAPTASIVLTNGASNLVHYNALPGTYAAGTLYAPGTSDNWNGNAASTGFTAAVPA